jgi:hypothetical protein
LVKIKFVQGSPFIWFMFILAIFVIGFVYVILSRPVSMTYNMFYDDPEVSEDVYQTFFRRAATLWYVAPLIIVVCLIMWSLIKTHQQEGTA